MNHHHIYRQSKARKDILPSKNHGPAMRQQGDCYDHHSLCHAQQVASCSRDKHRLHLNDNDNDAQEPQRYNFCQASNPENMVHSYFCPHFQGDPCLKMTKVEPDLRVQHAQICCHNRHESKWIHLEARSRSPQSSEYEDNHHTGQYHTKENDSNDRQHHQPTVKQFRSKTSNNPFDRVHRHAAPPEQGTFARATVCKSHEDGCGRNMKVVRFEEDGGTPEYAETRHSNCPIHHTPSPAEDQYQSHHNFHQHQAQSQDSRTYRWVWGPPLPAVVPQRGKIY